MRFALIISLLSFAALMTTVPSVASEFTRVTSALTVLPDPPQGHSTWVARSMRMNGLPMTLKTFSSRLTPDAVCQHYRYAGLKQHVESRLMRQGEWLTLSMRSTQELITIQARQILAGSEGTMTVSPLPATVHSTVATAFPHPVAAAVANLQEYDDDGVEAEHISLSSVRSIAVEAQSFMGELQRAGWQLQRYRSRVDDGQVIEAQKGSQHALLNFMRSHAQHGTAIVVVWRKS